MESNTRSLITLDNRRHLNLACLSEDNAQKVRNYAISLIDGFNTEDFLEWLNEDFQTIVEKAATIHASFLLYPK